MSGDLVIFLAFLIPIAIGIFSLLVLSKTKRVKWLVFLLTVVWQVVVVIYLFGNEKLFTSFLISVDFMVLKRVMLLFEYTDLGYIFFVGSTIITLIFAVFSMSYNDKKHSTNIPALWMMLMGANFAIFFSKDWLSFILAWELMGWTSYFIISHGRTKSAKAGLYYFVLSLIGTATLLAGILMVINLSGSLNIDEGIETISKAELWANNPLLPMSVAILFTVTFFAKSAVFPFYMWPSKAHAEAPDDFSAFLSGVMIKYGIFGMIAFVLPIFKNYSGIQFSGVPLYLVILGWIGAVTAVWGTLHAIREDDMKRLMAYSTVGNIGYIITALSVNTNFGIAAALLHTFNHMVFKGGIFLSMASVKFRTGEREMHKLGGMAYRMPVAFFTFLISIISAASIPPTSGFSSKWLVFQSMFDVDFLLLTIPIFFASTGAFMYLFRGLHTIYLGQLSPRFDRIKPAPPLQSVSMVLVMLIIMAVGFFPGIFLTPINGALEEMGYEALNSDMSFIQGTTSQINATVVGSVFLGGFVIVAIFFLIGKKRRVIKNRLDRYTSAEIPEEWGLTPEKYHFGMNFYDYFDKMTSPILNKISFDRLFKRIAYEFERISGSVRRWYKNPNFGSIALIGLLVALLILGWFLL